MVSVEREVSNRYESRSQFRTSRWLLRNCSRSHLDRLFEGGLIKLGQSRYFILLSITIRYYQPPTKLREGNVFIGVCLFTGVFLPPTYPHLPTPTYPYLPTPYLSTPNLSPLTTPRMVQSGWYTSYQNAHLLYTEYKKFLHNSPDNFSEIVLNGKLFL